MLAPLGIASRNSLTMLSPSNIRAEGTVFVVLKGYHDGSVEDGKSMTLACVAGHGTVWEEIEPAWESVRKDRGNPAYIHMAELFALEGIYKGWSADQRNYLVDGLLNVLL